MKIFELLTGSTAPLDNPNTPATAPMMTPPAPAPTTAAATQPAKPMQQANMLTDFFTTPQPIGGPATPAPAGTPTPGQPPVQTGSNIPALQRPIGGTAGGILDKINTGLTNQPK